MRIGQNTASAMGQGAFQLANMLGGIQNRQDDLVTKLARQRIEREKLQAEKDDKARKDKGVALYQGYAADNPTATSVQLADAALRFDVTDDDRVKNHLSANLSGNRFGETQDENVRKGERFTAKMEADEDRYKKNADAAKLKFDETIKRRDAEFDQRKKEHLNRIALGYAGIAQRNESLYVKASTGNSPIRGLEEFHAVEQQISQMKSDLNSIEIMNPKMVDPKQKGEISRLNSMIEKAETRRNKYLEDMADGKIDEEGNVVEIKKDKSSTPGYGGAQKTVAEIAAEQNVAPPAGATIPAGAQVRTAGNGKRYYVTNNKRIYID